MKQSDLLFELVAACVVFGQQFEPDWKARVGKAQEELKAYITKLEAENERLQNAWFVDETICPDGSLRPKVSALLERIAELEYNAANDAMSIHAVMNLLDINNETGGVSDDMYKTAHNLAYELRYRIAELEAIAYKLGNALKATYNKLPTHWRGADWCPYDYQALMVELNRLLGVRNEQ